MRLAAAGLLAIAMAGCNFGAVSDPITTCTSDKTADPVIYTCTLGSGTSVQSYLDPGTAGTNDLHVTYFGADGVELPIGTMTGSLSSPDGTASDLAWRQLEPGHFVTQTMEDLGTYHVSVTATAPNGEQIAVTIALIVAAAS